DIAPYSSLSTVERFEEPVQILPPFLPEETRRQRLFDVGQGPVILVSAWMAAEAAQARLPLQLSRQGMWRISFQASADGQVENHALCLFLIPGTRPDVSVLCPSSK